MKFDLKDLFLLTVIVIGLILQLKFINNVVIHKETTSDLICALIGFIIFYVGLPVITLRNNGN